MTSQPVNPGLTTGEASDTREALAKYLYYQSPDYDNTLWKKQKAGHLLQADGILAFLAKRAPPEPPKGTEPPARRAPVQGEMYKGVRMPPGSIAWKEHLEVWEGYHRLHPEQSAERIAERHGFAYGEISLFSGHEPRTWIKKGDPVPEPSPLPDTLEGGTP